MMKEYFTELEAGLQQAINNGNASHRKLYTLELARLGKRLYAGTDSIAWCGITAPFDLLHPLGVTSCFVEFIGAMLASTGDVGPFIEETDHAGYSSDACSYHRSVSGAALKGMMPVPEFLIGTTCPCSGGLAVLEGLARRFDRKLFVLHIPQDDSAGNVRFLADQMREMVAFVSHITGRKLDEESLRKSVENSNRASGIMKEIFALARQVPSPVASRDLGNFGIVMSLFLGGEPAIAIAEAYRDEFRKRIESGDYGRSGGKFRLLWIQNRIQFRHGLEKMLEEEYGASIISDELNDITWDAIDPENPFEGFARRSISNPFNGTIEKRIAHLKKLAREYRIDGAVNPCNWGCRQGAGARGLIEKGLKEIGVPVLNLEVDCVDSRKFTEGQLRTRLEAFMELLETREPLWR
ncbi:MAG: 2-hydroxyacyl-CoA dehydratase family protein [Smithellaceae bacterium]|nr:2-hydroxyacyl-CoA dehydratase family protein [Smithellaceae bacterium]